MNQRIEVDWGGHTIGLTWQPYKFLNPSEIVTSVHSFCFFQGKVMLVHVANRGFNIPGGHVELSENPEDALHREVYEEGYVTGNITYIGAIEVNHKKNSSFVEGGKYPLVGYQLFYRMDIQECHPFLRENETICRIWVEPEEVPFVIDDHEIAITVLREALQMEKV